jgi:putative transposase
MIDREHGLPLTRQAKLLDLSRSSLYYVAKGPSQMDLDLMGEIDQMHMEYPFAGARMLRDMLVRRGYRIGRRHVARLMRIEALYRERSTTKRHPGHAVFPYLLRIWQLSDRIMPGLPTSRISRCVAGSCICSR